MAVFSARRESHDETMGAGIPCHVPLDSENLPPAKRQKLGAGTESRDEQSMSSESDFVVEGSKPCREKIPDSEEDEGDVEDARSHDQKLTELESSLPTVKTDKESIAEYEHMRATGEAFPTDFKSRLNSMTWTKGRSSIYVDAFNFALQTVLEEEKHLFDEPEIEVFDQWKNLDYEAQYLYVRLFLRKTSAWHRLSGVGYHADIGDLPTAVKSLQTGRDLPESSADMIPNPGEPTPPGSLALGRVFRFADSSEAEVSTLEEASSLLNLEELKSLAKEAKVQGKNKGELLKALNHMSQRQTGLEWVGPRRLHGRIGIVSGGDYVDNKTAYYQGMEISRPDTGIEESAGGIDQENRDKHFVSKILNIVGPCLKLSIPALKLFERVHLVFYRSTEWTEKSLTTIILARISRRTFPTYVVSRSTNIFPSRSALLEFEAALRTQFHLDSILEFNGTPKKEGFEEVLSIFERVYPRWKILLQSEQQKEDHVYDTGEGAYLRRFSPAWVYTRIVHKACTVLGRFKMHQREWQMLTELLDQRLFHAARRGAWYQRKALLEEHYMAALKPIPSIVDVQQQKQHWRRMSLKTCELGLQDRDCHVMYHYDLQKRVQKLEKTLRLAKKEQHDFSHVVLRQPVEIRVTGIRVETADSARGNQTVERSRGAKTIWIDEREGGGECSVEEMCLSWYREQGWKGYHAEGGIIRTLFAYLFYDVLFLYIPNVFQTPYQTCPLDLHTDAFYPSRASEINHRLVEISNGSAERLIREVDSKERRNRTCVVGLNWDFELKDLVEIASCFEGTSLALICQVMAQEYRQRGGGIPDLFLWNLEKGEVMFSEVKSENDRLSDTQRLWIHVLTGGGIRVELCNAVAREIQTRRER